MLNEFKFLQRGHFISSFMPLNFASSFEQLEQRISLILELCIIIFPIFIIINYTPKSAARQEGVFRSIHGEIVHCE